MFEVAGNTLRQLGQFLHESMQLALELFAIFGKTISVNITLDAAVELFVGISLRRILGQIKYLNFILMLSQPLLDCYSTVDAQVIYY